jgi:hypothetical protein
MGSYGDDRYGGERGRERGREGFESRGDGRGGYGRSHDDRGFFDRAGDEVRSWLGDDEAQHRREMDQRRWEEEQRMTGRRDNDYGRGDGGRDDNRRYNATGGGGFGGGWGNQRGESWNRERPGERGWYEDEDRGRGRHYARGEREGWFSDSEGGERGRRYGGGRPEGGSGGDARRSQGGGHDPLYSQWRQRQIEDLDRDYDEWRREHQSRFEQEFGAWRSKRQSQRQSLGSVTEHMEVVGSDGSHVGTVDKVRGDRIILTRADPAAGGIHHWVPCSWVESVADKVTLNKSADEAKAEWRSEERSRAMFEREGEGGPRNLDRAFSGTYDEADGREASRHEGEPRDDR